MNQVSATPTHHLAMQFYKATAGQVGHNEDAMNEIMDEVNHLDQTTRPGMNERSTASVRDVFRAMGKPVHNATDAISVELKNDPNPIFRGLKKFSSGPASISGPWTITTTARTAIPPEMTNISVRAWESWLRPV